MLQELMKHLPRAVEKIGSGPNSVLFKLPNGLEGERALALLKREIAELPMFLIGSASLDLSKSLLLEVQPPRNETTKGLVTFAIKENLISKDAVVLSNNYASDFILLPTSNAKSIAKLNSLGFSVHQFGTVINKDFIGSNLPTQFVMVSSTKNSTSAILMENLSEEANIRFVGHGPDTIIFQIPTGSIGQKEFNKIAREASDLGATVIGSGIYKKAKTVQIQSCKKLFTL